LLNNKFEIIFQEFEREEDTFEKMVGPLIVVAVL
jgi:hypothetical protein